MGIEDGQPVEVITDYGSIVVKGCLSENLDKGLIFFPYGLWSNQVFGSATDGTGMPAYKGIRATVHPVEDSKILSLKEVVQGLKRK
jgi:formylmethanofuran dehydrogenase subunit D